MTETNGHKRYAMLPMRAYDDIRLNEKDRHTLAMIASHADLEGWCYPTTTTLAKQLGISRQAISKRIARLEKFEYLFVIRKKSPTGKPLINRYRVLRDSDLPAEYSRTKIREQGRLATELAQDIAIIATEPAQEIAMIATEQAGKVAIEHTNEHTREHIAESAWEKLKSASDQPVASPGEKYKNRVRDAMARAGDSVGKGKGRADPLAARSEEELRWAARIMSVLVQTEIASHELKRVNLDRSLVWECIWKAKEVLKNIQGGAHSTEDYERAFRHFITDGGEPYRTGRKLLKAYVVLEDVSAWLQRQRNVRNFVVEPYMYGKRVR